LGSGQTREFTRENYHKRKRDAQTGAAEGGLWHKAAADKDDRRRMDCGAGARTPNPPF
jgi:hypothetical protein